jgi:hypothetical protein
MKLTKFEMLEMFDNGFQLVHEKCVSEYYFLKLGDCEINNLDLKHCKSFVKKLKLANVVKDSVSITFFYSK